MLGGRRIRYSTLLQSSRLGPMIPTDSSPRLCSLQLPWLSCHTLSLSHAISLYLYRVSPLPPGGKQHSTAFKCSIVLHSADGTISPSVRMSWVLAHKQWARCCCSTPTTSPTTPWSIARWEQCTPGWKATAGLEGVCRSSQLTRGWRGGWVPGQRQPFLPALHLCGRSLPLQPMPTPDGYLGFLGRGPFHPLGPIGCGSGRHL